MDKVKTRHRFLLILSRAIAIILPQSTNYELDMDTISTSQPGSSQILMKCFPKEREGKGILGGSMSLYDGSLFLAG
jgi:hypothetical protein